jgi:NAD(P)-dependent dehydrogenase (short-subunit alcohol dehydrogenase family)
LVGGVFATLNRYCNARLWRPPASPLNIVVTGSTRGLGKALAREFLAHKDSVVITGRTPEAVAQAITEIKQELEGFGLSAVGSASRPGSRQQHQHQHQSAADGGGSSSISGPQLYGVVCDVTQPESVAALAVQAQVRQSRVPRAAGTQRHVCLVRLCCNTCIDALSKGFPPHLMPHQPVHVFSTSSCCPRQASDPIIAAAAVVCLWHAPSRPPAQELLGTVDVWICNAGYSGSFKPFLASDPAALEAVVKTNLLGTLLCVREASKLMLQQQLGGHIFMMDGAGADGSATPQYAAYGEGGAGASNLSCRGDHLQFLSSSSSKS